MKRFELIITFVAVFFFSSCCFAQKIGDKFVFTAYDKAGNADIHLIEITATGTGIEERAIAPHPAFDGAPAFSRDGRFIAFHSERDGDSDIWIYDLIDQKLWNLTKNDMRDTWPSWSPDGKSIVFTRRLWYDQIYIIDISTKIEERLTDTSSHEYYPAWSPDGKKIAFVSSRGGSPGIWLMDSNGKNQTPLIDSGSWELWPSWSPDGMKITFSADYEFHFGVYSAKADGSDVRPVYYKGDNPSWSPDGTRLVFTTTVEKNNADMVTVDSAGRGGLTRLTSTVTAEDEPDWWGPGLMQPVDPSPNPTPPSCKWGAKVRVTPKTNGNFEEFVDYLVAKENNELIFLTGLLLDENVNPSTAKKIPLEKISSIVLLDIPFNDPFNEGFNRYIVQSPVHGIETVELRNLPVVYDGIKWSLFRTKYDQGNNVRWTNQELVSFYAIPRALQQDAYNDRQQWVSNTKEWLKQAASKRFLSKLNNADKKRSIPPHVLYAIAWHESKGAQTQGWNQFGFISTWKANGTKLYIDDPDRKRTLVTFDGGCGIMQVTNEVAILGQQSDDDKTGGANPDATTLSGTLTHLHKMSYDPQYNIQVGAYILAKIKPGRKLREGYLGPQFIENWYWAIDGYGGNSPDCGYLDCIRNVIETAPYGLAIERVITASPNLSQETTAFPAHADVNFDGFIDLELKQPVVTANRQKTQHTLYVQVLPLNNSRINRMEVTVQSPTGTKQTKTRYFYPPLVRQTNVSFGPFSTLSAGMYETRINVTLDRGVAEGAVFRFSVSRPLISSLIKSKNSHSLMMSEELSHESKQRPSQSSVTQLVGYSSKPEYKQSTKRQITIPKISSKPAKSSSPKPNKISMPLLSDLPLVNNYAYYGDNWQVVIDPVADLIWIELSSSQIISTESEFILVSFSSNTNTRENKEFIVKMDVKSEGVQIWNRQTNTFEPIIDIAWWDYNGSELQIILPWSSIDYSISFEPKLVYP